MRQVASRHVIMLAVRDDPFPFEAVRDLIGILRAMYAAARERGAGERELSALGRIGRELHGAIALALEHPPGTLGHAAAWDRAERATRELSERVDCTTPLEPALHAAVRRLRSPAVLGAAREAARRARLRRG